MISVFSLVPALTCALFSAASGPAQPEARAVLEINTSDIGSAGPVIRRRVEERSNLILRRSEILPGNVGTDPVVGVRIREITGEDPGFSYEVWVSQGGSEIAGSRQAGICELCTESELVERVEDEVEKSVAFVRKAARPAAEEPGDEDGKKAPAQEPPPEGPQNGGAKETDDSKKLGPYGKAGIATLAGGAVALGSGVALSIRQPAPAQADPLKLYTTRPVGYALIGIGAAAAITGAVLVVLDRKGKGHKTVLLPSAGPGYAGVQLGGSF